MAKRETNRAGRRRRQKRHKRRRAHDKSIDRFVTALADWVTLDANRVGKIHWMTLREQTP